MIYVLLVINSLVTKDPITLALFSSIFLFLSEFEAFSKYHLQSEHLPEEDSYDCFRLTNFLFDLVLQRIFTARIFFLLIN